MVTYNNLRALSEGAVGYDGGSFVDEMPGISLEEAASYIPVVCLECQNELIDYTRDMNDAMVEAAIDGINYGSTARLDDLAEAGLDGLLKTIDNVFHRILEAIKSFIAKLRVHADKIFKSGEQLWAKYKNSDLLKRDFSKGDLTYNGWEFKDNSIVDKGSSKNIRDLVANGLGKGFPTPEKFAKQLTNFNVFRTDGMKTRKGSAISEDLKNMSNGERERRFAAYWTGHSNIGENWKADLKDELWGTKKEIKYGEGNFTINGIGSLLQNAGSRLKEIETEYTNLQKEISDMQKETKASAEKAASDAKDAADGKDAGKASLISEYYSTYVGYVNQAVGVVTFVKNMAISYQKDRYAQAKGMLGRLLSYKPPKANSSYYGDDSYDDFSFDL